MILKIGYNFCLNYSDYWKSWSNHEIEIRESQPSSNVHPFIIIFFSASFFFSKLWGEWEKCNSFFVFLSLSAFSSSSTKSTHLVGCKVAPLPSSTHSFLFLFLLSPTYLYLSLPPARAFALSRQCHSLVWCVLLIKSN